MNSKELLSGLIDNGWIYQLTNTPLLVFRPPMTRFLTAVRDIFIRRIAREHEFEEWLFPRMVPEEVLAKTGWLNFHREEAWLISPKREHVFDPENADLFPLQEKFPAQPLPYALDPIQCVSFYYSLYGTTISQRDLPMRVFEYQGGWTYRYETHPDGLQRGLGFLRLELIWLGIQSHAERIRNETLRSFVRALEEQLYLDVELGIADSCFEEAPKEGYDQKRVVEAKNIDRVLDVPSVDVIVHDPESGEYMEIASAGRHEKLPRRFQISIEPMADNPAPLAWSGCLGIGITRVAAAFLKKHGLDPDNWPREFKGVFDRTE